MTTVDDTNSDIDRARIAARRNEDQVAEMLREAASEITQGLVILDGDFRIVYTNPRYLKLYDLAPDLPEIQEGALFEGVLRLLANRGLLGKGPADALIDERMKSIRVRRNYSIDRSMSNGKHVNIVGRALDGGGYVLTFTDISDRVAEKQRLDTLVQERTRELSEANKKLVDGIEYASMIQTGIMPQKSFFEDNLGPFFIFFRPVDVVGGDFYLGVKTDYGIYVGLGDCTGHGIPGAMMTMMAASVCRRAINEAGAGGPTAVMMAVDRIVRTNLHQTDAEVGPDNGLELTLCLIEPDFERIRLAGAGLDILVQTKGKITRVRGTKHGLGYGRQATSATQIQETIMKCSEAERVFQYSDGILDQSGGEKGFGFGRRRLMDALEIGAGQSIEEQGDGMVKVLEDYCGDYEQRDDLAVMGFCPMRV